MAKTLSIASSTIGFGLISLAFFVGGMPLPAVTLIVLAVLLVISMVKQLDWAHIPWLFIAYGFIVAGFLIDLKPTLLFIASFFSLAGWDLADLSLRIRLAGPEDELEQLLKSHLVRLGTALLAGGVILSIASNLPLALPFGWLAILAILATLGLAVMINAFLRNTHDPHD